MTIDVLAQWARRGRLPAVLLLASLTAPVSAQWAPDVQLTNGSYDHKTCSNNGWALANDSFARVHIVWHDYRVSPSSPQILYRVYSPGTGWSADSQLTSTGNEEVNPAIAANRRGDLLVVWEQHDGSGNHQIRFKRRDVSTGWSRVESLTTTSYNKYKPAVAAGRGDTVWAVWYGNEVTSPANTQIYFRRRTSAGWGALESLTTGAYTRRDPSLASDGAGNVQVTWIGRSPATPSYDQVFCRRRQPGGWDTTEQVTSGAVTRYTPSVAVDRNGDVHVVWHEYVGAYAQVFYARRTSSGWDAPLALTSSAYSKYYPSVAVDTAAGVHVAWYGTDVGSAIVLQLFYRYRSPTSGWQAQQQLTAALSASREQVTIAVLPTQRPNVVWRDNRDSYWQIFYKGPQVADVGALAILAPSGTVDSGSVTLPRAVVRNYGSSQAIFPVDFRIGAYANTVTCTLNASTTDTLVFPGWTATVRGNNVTLCTTRLAGDANPGNDVCTSSVLVRVRDVGCRRIVAPLPLGTVDSSTAVVPACTLYNFGTAAESYAVRMRIGMSYNNTASVTNHAAGTAVYVTFPSWTATTRNWNLMRCSTELAADQVAGNNLRLDSVFVRVRDIYVVPPIGPWYSTVNFNASVPCTARIRNQGNTAESLRVRFRIGSVMPYEYADSAWVTLAPARDSLLRFANWIADSIAVPNFPVRCTAALGSDQVGWNNYQPSTVTVRAHDVQPIQVILTPPPASTWYYDSGATVTPSAAYLNNGTTPDTFMTRIRIDSIYADSGRCTLALAQRDTVAYRPWLAVQRGWHLIRCTTELAGDNVPGNNRLTQWVMIRVYDVSVDSIAVPRGTVDSGATITPRAYVRNRGTQLDSCRVRLRIGSVYDRTVTATIAAGASAGVTFPAFAIAGRGVVATACTAALAADRIAGNNLVTGVCTLRVRDVGVVRVMAPAGTIDSGAVVVPACTLINTGAQAENYVARMRIGAGYSTAVNVNAHAAGARGYVTFPAWTATERGWNALVCSLDLSGDIVPGNNQVRDSVWVRVRNLAAAAILEPSVGVAESAWCRPRAVIENRGNTSEQYTTRFRMRRDGFGEVYYADTVRTLASGRNDTLQFADWLATPDGGYHAALRVSVPGDIVPADDSLDEAFTVLEVTTRDVGTRTIISPSGTVYPGLISVRAIVMNFGEASETFWTKLRMWKEGLLVYMDSVEAVSLGAGREETLAFANWTATAGSYTEHCTTMLRGDEIRSNDGVRLAFVVDSAAPGSWAEMAQFPAGPKNKRVKNGTCVAYHPDSGLYALKGNNTVEFYQYNIAGNFWTTRESLPFGPLRKKRAGKGAALAYSAVANRVYALKGNSTTEFWAFHPDSLYWAAKTDIPAGTSGRVLKGGSALCAVDSGRVLYALKGTKSFEFWCYDVRGDSWTEKRPVPSGLSNKPVGEGGALADAGNGQLYAFKGNSRTEFFRYDVAKDSWFSLPDIPTGLSRKKVKDGAGLASDRSGTVYGMKGNNSAELYSFGIGLNYWVNRLAMPGGSSSKRPKSGGTLVYADGRLYSTKGNSTFEFWRFDPGLLAEQPPARPGSQDQGSTEAADVVLFPNPTARFLELVNAGAGSVRLRVMDVSGRVLWQEQVGPGIRSRLDFASHPVGIYLVALEQSGIETVHKVVVRR
jgi:hypothetical protein